MCCVTVCLTSTSAHPTRFGAYAYPAWQPVTSAVQGWIVCHPRSSLHSTPLSVSCRSCLLSCSPLWPHLSQMSGAAYPVNLCVRAWVGVCLHLHRSFSLVPPSWWPSEDTPWSSGTHKGRTGGAQLWGLWNIRRYFKHVKVSQFLESKTWSASLLPANSTSHNAVFWTIKAMNVFRCVNIWGRAWHPSEIDKILIL